MSDGIAMPKAHNFKNLTGERFGRLLVLNYAGKRGRQVTWNCQCDCGQSKIVRALHLRSGHTQSCGCLQIEAVSSSFTTHGESTSREFSTWLSMIQRCTNPKSTSYPGYGGRGITVDPRWINDFSAFLSHIGRAPSPGHQVDRIDNDGNYEPGNVRWATKKQNARNRRSNRMVERNGEIACLAEWCERAGLSQQLVHDRLVAGWSMEEALGTTSGGRRKKP